MAHEERKLTEAPVCAASVMSGLKPRPPKEGNNRGPALSRGAGLAGGFWFLALWFGASWRAFWWRCVREFVGFAQPAGDGWLDFVAVADLDDVEELGFGRAVDAAHLRSLKRATKEDTELEEAPLGAHEEVAGFAR